MSNYIFLDIDGVLTSARVHIASRKKGVWAAFDPVAVSFLEKVVMRWPAEIVISSTWRTLYKRHEWINLFGTSNLDTYFHQSWCTPTLAGIRGLEVKAWLHKHGGKDYSYIIIDDNSDFLPGQMKRLVKTDPNEGMLEHHYRRILDMTQLAGKL